MDSIDEYDIRESFDSLDDDKTGRLSMSQFYTLYLGLGYPKMTQPELTNIVAKLQKDETVTIGTVLKVLSKYSRDRQAELSNYFALIDQGSKGYISVQDIEELARQAGDSLAEGEAEAMIIQTTAKKKLYENEFRKLLAPPSP